MRPSLVRAASVVNIHPILASAALRPRCHAAISRSSRSRSAMRRLKHWPLRTPISISAMFSQLACLGVKWNLEPTQEAMCLLGRKGLVERARRVGREIVQHHPDPLRLRVVDLDELAHASGEVEGRTLLGDRDLAPGAVRVHEHEQVHRPGTPVLVVEALHLPRRGRDRLAHLADELGRALVEAHDGALRVRCLGIEVEHVLHAGDELAVDARDAPHLLTPGLERVLGEAPTSRLAGEAGVRGGPHHLAGQQLQGPAGPPLGRAHAVATSSASSLPVSLRAAPGCGSSSSARSTPPSTKRRLTRQTVETPTSRLMATVSSATPASAASRIWARLSLRAACLPPPSMARSSPRSTSLNSTR